MATEAYADTKARIAEEEADVHLTADLGGQKALDKSKIAANRCAAIAIAASTPSKASGMEPQQQDAHDANANAWDSRRLRDTVRMAQLTVECALLSWRRCIVCGDFTTNAEQRGGKCLYCFDNPGQMDPVSGRTPLLLSNAD